MKNNSYEDIINLPHPVSKNHPQMPLRDRAAQFAPFAALTGYDEEIEETTRLTTRKHILDEESVDKLNENLNIIKENVNKHLEIKITYFIADLKKEGGKYINKTGKVKTLDLVNGYIKMIDNEKIYFEDITEIVIL